MKTAAVILSAGESRRMGRPKAWLPFRTGTFLSTLAETLGGFCSPVIAVFGFDAERMLAQAPEGIAAVANPNYRQGMLTSLQAGLHEVLHEVPGDCGRVLFTLVDHPAVEASTVEQLLRSDAPIVIPRFRGKRGHPVLISRGVAQEFLAEPDTAMVRDVIDRHAAKILYIDVEDAGICDDIDSPELYEMLMAREAARA